MKVVVAAIVQKSERRRVGINLRQLCVDSLTSIRRQPAIPKRQNVVNAHSNSRQAKSDQCTRAMSIGL